MKSVNILKTQREDQGLSLEQLARKTDLPLALIRKIEEKENLFDQEDEIYKSNLRTIYKALGLGIGDLISCYIDDSKIKETTNTSKEKIRLNIIGLANDIEKALS